MKQLRFALLALVGSAGFISASLAQIVEQPVPGDPVVTDGGRLAGKLLPSGVRVYFGVPFAAPPVRELRWREPQPVKPWQGVFNADRFAPECIQILRPHNINHYFGEEATSEDCLYLNLWAPPPPGSEKGNAKLPVLVWIYGGGFSIGSASMPNYQGEHLAQKGVIYVSIAYRVGGFGFMAHPQLTAESPNRASGNYGHLDQVAALQWIQRNIARFGGDPQRVIVMGQSAGASSVFSLQASPLARGLFQGIVGMSGGGLRTDADPASLSEAEQSGLELQKVMKVGSLADLRNIPADRLLAAQAEFQLGGTAGTVRFRPNVDGYFFTHTPRETFAAGNQNDVPIVVGFTRDESSNELRTAQSVQEYKDAAQKYFADKAAEFLRLYPASTDADVRVLGAQAARDGGMATSTHSWALAQVATGKSPAYVYMYAHPHPYTPGVTFADQNPATAGAYHSSEVPYFLLNQDAYNSLRQTRNWTAFDRDLADRMSNALIAFAQTGKPDTAAMRWPQFTRSSEKLIELTEPVRVATFDTKRMAFFATVNSPGAVGPAAAPRMPRD